MTADDQLPGDPSLPPGLVMTVLDVVRDAVLVIDADDLIVYANPVAAHDYGGQRALVGRRLWELLPGLSDTRVVDDLRAVRSGGGPVIFDEYLASVRRWYRVDLDPAGDHVVVQVREITETRRNERVGHLVARLGAIVAESERLNEALVGCALLLRDELDFDIGEVWAMDALTGELRLVTARPTPGHVGAAAFVEGTPSSIDDDEAPPRRAARELGLVVTDDAVGDPSAVRAALSAETGIRSGVHMGVDLGGGRRVVLGLLRAGLVERGDAVELLRRIAPHLETQWSRHAASLDLVGFFDVTGEAIALVGFDGGIRRANPAFARLIGADPDALLHRQVREFLHPDDVRSTVERIAASVRGKAPLERLENRIVSADGLVRWMSWTVQAFLDERVLYASGRDVTTDRADRLRRETYNRVLHDVIADAPLAVSLAHVCHLLESQHQGVRASVVSVDADLGTLHVASAPSLPARYLDMIEGAAIGPATGSCGTAIHERREVFVTDMASDPLWAGFRDEAAASGARACWSIPILDAGGQALGSFALYTDEARPPRSDEVDAMRDAVQLAGIAIDHRRTVDAEASSSERFRILSEVTTDAIFDIDFDRRTRWASEGFRALFGQDPAAMVADDDWWPEHIHPDDYERVWTARDQVLRSDERDWRDEFRYKRADGSYADVTVRATVARHPDGRPRRLVGGLADMTERKLLEQQYLRAQRVESLGTLAGGIAHDLNNALAPITMAVDLLQGADVDDDLADTIQIIGASARRSADMVRQILTFARGAEGERTIVPVADVVHEAVQIVRDAFPKQIEIRVQLGIEDVAVLADPTQLHQVIVNLALNARDAMPDGGVLDVSVRLADVDSDSDVGSSVDLRPGRYVVVEVRDSGTGITPAVLDRIFEPFFTTKARAEGTGLGLPTSLAIVRSHGGDLAVRTEPGVGSTFTIFLPSAHRRDAPTEGARRVDDGTGGDGLTVLLVDDEPVVRKVLHDTLRAAGYDVISATDGRDALEVLDRTGTAVDVVLTDVMMAPMDGADLAAALRERGLDVPILAMTGLDETQRSAALARHGVTVMLSKPFDRRTLLQALRDACAEDLVRTEPTGDRPSS